MFEIYVFDIRSVGDLGGTEELITSALEKIDLQKNAHLITDKDIIDYDWNRQTIKLKNIWKSQSQEIPQFMKDSGYFLVMFQGKRLFGGRIAQYGTARPIDFSVMLYDSVTSLKNTSSELTYLFRPSADPRIQPPLDFLAEDAAVAEQVRAHFKADGKLKE